jgi:hypothetical protein
MHVGVLICPALCVSVNCSSAPARWGRVDRVGVGFCCEGHETWLGMGWVWWCYYLVGGCATSGGGLLPSRGSWAVAWLVDVEECAAMCAMA